MALSYLCRVIHYYFQRKDTQEVKRLEPVGNYFNFKTQVVLGPISYEPINFFFKFNNPVAVKLGRYNIMAARAKRKHIIKLLKERNVTLMRTQVIGNFRFLPARITASIYLEKPTAKFNPFF